MKNSTRVITIIGGAVIGGLVLDNWTGADALASTGFTGVTNLATSLRSGKSTTTTATKAST